jgi:hypothetical protein
MKSNWKIDKSKCKDLPYPDAQKESDLTELYNMYYSYLRKYECRVDIDFPWYHKNDFRAEMEEVGSNMKYHYDN